MDGSEHGRCMGQTGYRKSEGRTDTKYVAFLPGGYSTADDQGNSFYIVDIETGTTLKKLDKVQRHACGGLKE